jgi:hypothetical protein
LLNFEKHAGPSSAVQMRLYVWSMRLYACFRAPVVSCALDLNLHL